MPGEHQLTAFQEAVSWSFMAFGRSSGSHQMRLSPGQQGAHSPAGQTHYPRGSETSPCPLGRACSKASLWVPCPQSALEGLRWDLRFCISTKIPDVAAAHWTTLGEPLTKDSVANRAGDRGGASSGKRCRCKKSGPGGKEVKVGMEPS